VSGPSRASSEPVRPLLPPLGSIFHVSARVPSSCSRSRQGLGRPLGRLSAASRRILGVLSVRSRFPLVSFRRRQLPAASRRARPRVRSSRHRPPSVRARAGEPLAPSHDRGRVSGQERHSVSPVHSSLDPAWPRSRSSRAGSNTRRFRSPGVPAGPPSVIPPGNGEGRAAHAQDLAGLRQTEGHPRTPGPLTS